MSDESLPTAGMAMIDVIQQTVAEILHIHKEGISEYALISQLETCPQLAKLLSRKKGDNLALFRIHFLVCHVLYRLMDEWHQSQSAHLEISALLIRKHPYEASVAALAAVDKVRDYYLDLNHLIETDAQGVDELLAAFWIGMNRYEHRDTALDVLGLSDPVDDETIRKTYRSLVMQHHPDRGGDKELIQQLNDAAHLLLKTK